MTHTARRKRLARRGTVLIAFLGVACLCISLPALLGPPGAAAQSGPALLIDPDLTEVHTGERFTVSVAARDIVDLMAFQFTVTYDPGMLRFHDAAVGPFLGSTGRRVRPVGPVTRTGLVTFGATSFPGGPGPSGGGTLAYLGFSAESPGDSPLDLDRVLLSDTLNRPITVTAVTGGIVTVSGAPVSWPRIYLPFSQRPQG